MRLSSVIVLAVFLVSFAGHAQSTPSVAVKAALLMKQTLADTVGGFGTVATSDKAVADLTFLHAGRITQLHVRQSEIVHAGEPLVELAADPAALLTYEQARAALDFAQRELERMRTLVQQHLATNAQLAAALKATADAEAALATERKLGNDQRTEVARAPFDGYVVSLAAALGDHVAAGAPVLKLARADQGAHVLLGLEPEEARRIAPGMASRVTSVFSPDQDFHGKVQSIAGAINQTTRRIDVWIDIPQAPAELVSGTTVSVQIVVAEHTGWAVPRSAVLHDAGGDYVFQINNGKAKRVDVKTGLSTDQVTEISGVLDPALQVVILGNYELRDGMSVRDEPASSGGGSESPQ